MLYIGTSNIILCDGISGNGSKSHMKYTVFLHIFNDISRYFALNFMSCV